MWEVVFVTPKTIGHRGIDLDFPRDGWNKFPEGRLAFVIQGDDTHGKELPADAEEKLG